MHSTVSVPKQHIQIIASRSLYKCFVPAIDYVRACTIHITQTHTQTYTQTIWYSNPINLFSLGAIHAAYLSKLESKKKPTRIAFAAKTIPNSNCIERTYCQQLQLTKKKRNKQEKKSIRIAYLWNETVFNSNHLEEIENYKRYFMKLNGKTYDC